MRFSLFLFSLLHLLLQIRYCKLFVLFMNKVNVNLMYFKVKICDYFLIFLYKIYFPYTRKFFNLNQ